MENQSVAVKRLLFQLLAAALFFSCVRARLPLFLAQCKNVLSLFLCLLASSVPKCRVRFWRRRNGWPCCRKAASVFLLSLLHHWSRETRHASFYIQTQCEMLSRRRLALCPEYRLKTLCECRPNYLHRLQCFVRQEAYFK